MPSDTLDVISQDDKELVMSLSVIESNGGNTVTVKLPGEFDFRLHKEFRAAHKGVKAGTEFIIDFAQTEHIDSSALGMLLLLREELGNDKANVKLINCREKIKLHLEMASFDLLFKVA